MTFALLGWMIAGFGIPALAFTLLHFIKLSTKLRQENEDLQKSIAISKNQADISSRPRLSDDALLKRMYDDK